MQYTPSSFGQPLVTFFAPLLGVRRSLERPSGIHAERASVATTATDPARERLWRPLFRLLAAVANRLRVLQHGRVQLYVLAIAATLLVLLVLELSAS
jgi:hypothetical protein